MSNKCEIKWTNKPQRKILNIIFMILSMETVRVETISEMVRRIFKR